MQTARRAIARGDIGEPLSAQTVMQYIGPDIFHPNPEFLFAPGAGPLFDIGPYYLTALVQLFGSVRSVAAVGSKSRTTRTIQAGDRAGTVFDVQVPTHVSAIAQLRRRRRQPECVQLRLPVDPDGVRGGHRHRGDHDHPRSEHVHRRRQDHPGARRSPRSVRIRSGRACRSPACTPNGASACSTWRGRPGPAGKPLASGELGFHVLDTLVAIDEAITEDRVVAVDSRVDRVPLVADDFDPFAATL